MSFNYTHTHIYSITLIERLCKLFFFYEYVITGVRHYETDHRRVPKACIKKE
jgi:hypothetical protein